MRGRGLTIAVIGSLITGETAISVVITLMSVTAGMTVASQGEGMV
jgi:hypothetical protein